MMHNDQLKVFYVGGPNQRKDFHMEEGEELFYMRKGDMSLPILEGGKITTIRIKEGDVFLLPACVPHSPQRDADTVGLVVERERLTDETDGLRYFVGDTTDILFERWFHCDDLGIQLKPIIEEFFASEECKSGMPGSGTSLVIPPWEADSQVRVEKPFNLQDWLDSHRRLIRSSGCQPLFSPVNYQSDVIVLGLGQGSRILPPCSVETLFWQLEGCSTVTLSNGEEVRLRRDETYLIPPQQSITYNPSTESLTMSVVMDPENKNRPSKRG